MFALGPNNDLLHVLIVIHVILNNLTLYVMLWLLQ